MEQIVLDVTPQMAKYFRQKGFAEIFVRNGKAQCEAIAKVLLKTAKESQKDKIADIAVKAAGRIGLSDNALAEFRNEILRHIDPQFARKQLANLARNQTQNTAMLKNLAKNVSGIYAAVSSLQIASWLNVALSAANLAATVASTVIICNKLDHIDRKLDRIEGKIDAIARAQFVIQIKQPGKAVIMNYKLIATELRKGKDVPEGNLLDEINQCCLLMETIYSLRKSYPTGDVLDLLFDLMPVLTDLIVLYYQHFYDPAQGKHTLHQDWMRIFDLLDSDDFRNEIQDYLILEENIGNRQVNEILDCQRLVTIGSKQKIEELLSDLRMCDSAEGYRQVMQFSEQYALQQAKTIEEELKDQFGAVEAENIMSRARQQLAFAN